MGIKRASRNRESNQRTDGRQFGTHQVGTHVDSGLAVVAAHHSVGLSWRFLLISIHPRFASRSKKGRVRDVENIDEGEQKAPAKMVLPDPAGTTELMHNCT